MIRMKAERLQRQWSQTTYAYRSKTSISDISRIECGRLTPSDAQRRKLARPFGIDPTTLLDEVPEPVRSVA